jgi:hypothetical protein
MTGPPSHVCRVVVLAYYFPPLAGIASERAAALSRHLVALGWDPVVITTRDGLYHRADSPADTNVPVVRTPSFELSRLLRAIYVRGNREANKEGTVLPVETGRLGEQARRFVRDFVYVPDAQVGWIPFAASAAAKALRQGHSPAVIYSTSVPYSAHLAAMLAARRRNCPWVAELRDPWSTSTSPYRSERRSRQRIDKALERRVVLGADHVVLTSESTRAELLDAHGELRAERVSVVTNGFEPLPERAVPPRDAPMTIVYAGTVAAGEDLAPVLAALDRVDAGHKGAFRVRVLGPPEPWGSPSDRPWLDLEGVVSPQLAREAVAEASALLFVQRHPAYSGVLPGKLFEYIGARRPIVAVCPPHSEMEALLKTHADARLVNPDQVENVASVVERLLQEHEVGSLQGPRVPFSVTAALQRSEQAARLASIFEQVLDRRRAG